MRAKIPLAMTLLLGCNPAAQAPAATGVDTPPATEVETPLEAVVAVTDRLQVDITYCIP